jgi:hypothetical protein
VAGFLQVVPLLAEDCIPVLSRALYFHLLLLSPVRKGAAGQGEDTRVLPDKVVVLLRHWALDWLRADLSAYSTLASQDNPAIKRAIQQQLMHWQQDPDLASVRDRAARDGLPEQDRAAWQSL